jgi:hypothetical protein
MWRLKLARLAVNLMLAAAVETILCLQTVSAAPISAIDPHSGEPAQGGPPSFTAGSLLEKKTTPPDPLIDVPGAHIPPDTCSLIEATGWRGADFFCHIFLRSPRSGLLPQGVQLNVADDNYKYSGFNDVFIGQLPPHLSVEAKTNRVVNPDESKRFLPFFPGNSAMVFLHSDCCRSL